MKKPLILVHERDPAKGGISLQEAMDECPGNNLYIIETDIYAYKDRVNPTTFTHISDVCIYISFAPRGLPFHMYVYLSVTPAKR